MRTTLAILYRCSAAEHIIGSLKLLSSSQIHDTNNGHYDSCCNRTFHQLRFHQRRSYVRLSPNEVTNILRKKEFTQEVNLGSVKSFDSNQLQANNPIEDMRTEARCLLTTGMLFGVFDGHGGPACGQVVAKRLFRYIASSLLPRDVLLKTIEQNDNGSDGDYLLECYNDRYDLVEDLRKLYRESFQNYVKDLSEDLNVGDDFKMHEVLEKSFLRLDDDLNKEALSHGTYNINLNNLTKEDSLAMKTLSVALSGAVACVAHVDGEHLHIANCGDCRAVLGTRGGDSDGDWLTVNLSSEHNAENVSEIKRILSEHPESEKDTVMKNDRLLGQLAPLRAFGDFKFKWTEDQIKNLIAPVLGEGGLAPNSLTPPYLTCRPQVVYHKLKVKDSFLILASDGLWDMMTPTQAVRLVGEHMSGKTVLNPYRLPENESATLGEIHSTLLKRMESFKLKPIDQNSATHLIRHALGGTEHGLDHNKISNLLTLPNETARLFRDDISITIIFFDSEYLSQRPL